MSRCWKTGFIKPRKRSRFYARRRADGLLQHDESQRFDMIRPDAR